MIISKIEFNKSLGIVRLAGAITRENLPEAQNEYARATKNKNVGSVLFDLAGLAKVDSAGIAALIDLMKYMKQHHIQGKIGLLNVMPQARELMTLSRVKGLFAEYLSEAEALSDLGSA